MLPVCGGLWGLSSPQHGTIVAPADVADCPRSEQNSDVLRHPSHFMKEITFLEALQLIAVCRKKIQVKHI